MEAHPLANYRGGTPRPEHPVRKILRTRIKEAREELGMSIQDVAAQIDDKASSIKHWEDASFNNFNVVHLASLAKCYGVSTDWLLGLKEDRYG